MPNQNHNINLIQYATNICISIKSLRIFTYCRYIYVTIRLTTMALLPYPIDLDMVIE